MLCTVILHKVAVNGGITKSYVHKGRDDYQNEEEIFLLVQFPLLLFWGAYFPNKIFIAV